MPEIVTTAQKRLWDINGHISSNSSRPHNDTVDNTIMPRLTPAQRSSATGRLQAGATRQTVARYFGVSTQTISALTTTVQDEYILVRHLRDRTTATQIL